MRDNQQTKLGRATAAPTPPSKFSVAALGARVFEPYKIPRLNLDVLITLVPHNRSVQLESDVIDYMERQLKIELNATTELDYEAERAARFCSEAFLDPETKTPIGTLEEWREKVDVDVIQECWRQYAAVRVAYDPVAQPLTDADFQMIEDVIKKKAEDPGRSLAYLRLFGVRRLSHYLLRSADRLFPSPIPTSSPSESSPD